MQIPVFLSVPKSFLRSQEEFLMKVEAELRDNDLDPKTLGRTEYDMDAPLTAIRRLMIGSCGLMALAFRRTHIQAGSDRPASDLGEVETSRNDTWLTSPYCQIEPAMAYQIGLPLLIWRESGVSGDGILDRGAMGIALPEFDLYSGTPNLKEPKWRYPLNEWISRVKAVYRNRGAVPQLWER